MIAIKPCSLTTALAASTVAIGPDTAAAKTAEGPVAASEAVLGTVVRGLAAMPRS